MKPATDYLRDASRFARAPQRDAAIRGTPASEAEFDTVPSKPHDEIAAGLELASARA